MLLGIIIIIGIIALAEHYFYQALKNLLSPKLHLYLRIVQLLWIFIILIVFGFLLLYKPHRWHDWFRVILSIVAIIEISKLFGSIFMLLDDIRRYYLFYLKLDSSHKCNFLF